MLTNINVVDSRHVEKENNSLPVAVAQKNAIEKSKMSLCNLVPRVLGLFGQRVSAQRDSGIIDSIFPENVGSGLMTYGLNGSKKTVNSGNGGLKVFEKQEF